MTKRTFSIIMSFGICAITVTAVLATAVFYGCFERQVYSELKSICLVVQAQSRQSGDLSFVNSANDSDTRITVIDKNGNVTADSAKSIAESENHADREEYIEAVKNGEGFSKRHSDTSGESCYYYAVKTDNGSVIRASTQVLTVWRVLKQIGPLTAVMIGVLLLISALISVGLTKKIIKPVEQLADHLDAPQEVKVYKELQPFVNALANQKKKQKALDKQKKQFTANMSHELKTPLTSIAGYAELIETGIAGENDIKPFASTIRKQALRLVALSEDIIRLSQLDESDDQTVTFASVDLYETAEKCVSALAINAQLKNISITLNGSSAYIKANATLLEELVYNLCDNAIRYNKPNGSVEVSVQKLDGKTQLTVKDTGIGIDKKYHNRIFERFFRVDKSRSKETGGTGLGLAIVKHIAEIHNADIKIDSVLGAYTTISVAFQD